MVSLVLNGPAAIQTGLAGGFTLDSCCYEVVHLSSKFSLRINKPFSKVILLMNQGARGEGW